MKATPNYKKIYEDLILIKFPDKIKKCEPIMKKNKFTIMDIIKLNQIISGTKSDNIGSFNQKLKSYDKAAIFIILDYQKRYKLNNVQTAEHFKISRNTLGKWRKIFLV